MTKAAKAILRESLVVRSGDNSTFLILNCRSANRRAHASPTSMPSYFTKSSTTPNFGTVPNFGEVEVINSDR
jgi:hypothetical protein